MLKKYAGKVRCLGWCNKEFMSPNKVYVRLCGECKERSNNIRARRNSKYLEIKDKKGAS